MDRIRVGWNDRAAIIVQGNLRRKFRNLRRLLQKEI